MLEDLIRGLRRVDADIDAVALADALWLCGLMRTQGAGPAPDPDEQSATSAPVANDESAPATGERDGGEGDVEEEELDVFDSPGRSGSRRAVVGHADRGPALPDALAVARALRPLKRAFPHGREVVLDAEATVRAYTETREVTPVLSPRPERWFHLDLVVEESASMQVWQDVAEELLALFQQLGAFRTVRRWVLDAQSDVPVLYDPSGSPVPPDHLKDPHSRRLIAVFSDCVADGWYTPQLWQTLRAWGRSTATVLFNPLPDRLWPHTGLDGAVVPLAPAEPGVRAAGLGFTVPAALRVLSAMTGRAVRDWVPCPVAGISAASLGAWASTVMATGTNGCEGILIPPGGRLSDPDDDAHDDVEPGSVDPGPDSLMPSARQLVRAFRHVSSAAAGRLAVLCSPQTELSLPIMRAVQQTMEPDSGVAELAELVVSGLFEHAPDSEAGDLKLRFKPGVREELHKSLAAEDAWQVRLALTRFIERKTAQRPSPFAVAAQHGDARVPAALAPFTTASEAIRQRVGAVPPDAALRPVVAVLATLSMEYEAVRAHLTALERLVHPSSGTVVEFGQLEGTDWHVALAEIGEGQLAAPSIVERITNWLSPQALFSVGLASGLKDHIEVGDVVVATKVYGLHTTQSRPGFVVRSEAWRPPHRMEQAARYALRGKAHVKPIAAGAIVADSDAKREMVRSLHADYNDAVAIDMAGAGIVQAAHLTGALDTLIIRGISDNAYRGKKQADSQQDQRTAAQNAAAATVAVLRALEPRAVHQPSTSHAPASADAPLPAEGNATPVTPHSSSPSPQATEREPQLPWPGSPSQARIILIALTTDPVLAGSRFLHTGTGFLLGPRLILSAQHVLQRRGPQDAIKVRKRRGRVTADGWVGCRVVWESARHDAVLLLADEDIADPTTDSRFTTPGWAQLYGTEPLNSCYVTAVNVQEDQNFPQASMHVTGILHPEPLGGLGAYVFEPVVQEPQLSRVERLPRNLSGAPVFCENSLLGFVVAIQSRNRPEESRLAVAGLGDLVRAPGFADACLRYLQQMPRIEVLPATSMPQRARAEEEPAQLLIGVLPESWEGGVAQPEDLEADWERARDERLIVLGGPVAVEKRAFAAARIRRERADRTVDLVIWASARSANEVRAYYAESEAALAGTTIASPTDGARALFRRLETMEHPWIVVIDGLDELPLPNDLTPPLTPYGRVFITGSGPRLLAWDNDTSQLSAQSRQNQAHHRESSAGGGDHQTSPHFPSVAVSTSADLEVRELITRARFVLFDFDGPICRLFAGHSAEQVAGDLVEWLEGQGLRGLLTDAERQSPDPHTVLHAVNRRHPRSDLVAELEERLTKQELRAVSHAWPTAFADLLIRTWNAVGSRLAVATDNSPRTVVNYLSTRDLMDCFAPHIYGRTQALHLLKPDPHCLNRALSAMGSAPSDTLMISSTPVDLEAARHAGIHFLGYARNEQREKQLKEAGAQAVVNSLESVLRILRGQ